MGNKIGEGISANDARGCNYRFLGGMGIRDRGRQLCGNGKRWRAKRINLWELQNTLTTMRRAYGQGGIEYEAAEEKSYSETKQIGHLAHAKYKKTLLGAPQRTAYADFF